MSDMKCPFCGEKLEPYYGFGIGLYSCSNLTCKGAYMNAEDSVWQELIRTRKALEISVDALKYANKCIKGGCINWETEIDKALDKIKTTLEQKDVK